MGNRNFRFLIMLLIFFLVSSFIDEKAALARMNFKDVSSNHWAYSAINWGYSKGIVSGFSDGTFRPEKPVSEAEFISMLIRFDCQLNKSLMTSNRKGEHWASANYRYMSAKKMPLLGYTNITKRDEPIRRGQVARMIAAFDGYDLSEPYAVLYMYKQNLSNGETGKRDYADYGVDKTLTRAESIVFLERLSKRNHCSIQGLTSEPRGNDNYQYEPLPMNFFGEGTVSLPNITPPPTSGGGSTSTGRGYEVDIEKETLIANGRDRTFITVTLNDCQGRPIDYDTEGQFRISSKEGAYIDERFRSYQYDGENSYYSGRSVAYVMSDGPEVTVEVTAIRSNVTVNDTIYFEYTGDRRNSNGNYSCYRKEIAVPVSYVPQPELRVEAGEQVLRSDGTSTTEVRATIIRPGGDTIYNYHGQVRFRSSQGAYLSNELVSFNNGVARTTVTSISSNQFIEDEITVEIVNEDTRYRSDIGSIADRTHSVSVYYEPLPTTSCPLGTLDVAFVIDASGSMKRSDPDRKRVTKSQELVHHFTAGSRFLGVEFNSSARFFSSPFDVASYIYPRFNNVRQSGGTSISAGLNRAISSFESNANQKVIILLTDGKTNRNQVLNAASSAKAKGISIYPIGLGHSNQIDEELLKKIASETNGQYFHVLNSAEIGAVYQQILDSIACGKTTESCSNAITTFESVTVEKTSTHLEASLFVREACENDIQYVSLMLRSYSGDVYYDFTHQGYNLYELRKSRQEIVNLDLFNEATIIAYDKNLNELTRKTIPIK